MIFSLYYCVLELQSDQTASPVAQVRISVPPFTVWTCFLTCDMEVLVVFTAKSYGET